MLQEHVEGQTNTLRDPYREGKPPRLTLLGPVVNPKGTEESGSVYIVDLAHSLLGR